MIEEKVDASNPERPIEITLLLHREGGAVIRLGIGIGAASLGVGLGVTLPLMALYWIGAHPPLDPPPPVCPPGSYLYARSLLEGKWQTPIYHCFRDADQREYTIVEPRPT